MNRQDQIWLVEVAWSSLRHTSLQPVMFSLPADQGFLGSIFSRLKFVKGLEKYTWPPSLKGVKELLLVHMQEQGVWFLLPGSGEPHLSLALGVWWDRSPSLHMHVQGRKRDQVCGVFLYKSAADHIVCFCWNQQFKWPFSDA